MIPRPFRNKTSFSQRLSCAVAVAAFLLPLGTRAATLPTGFSETVFASGLSAPTAMAFAPDGRLFVCQQGGRLRVIKNGALLPDAVCGLEREFRQVSGDF